MKIALAQMVVKKGDVQGNEDRAAEFLRRAGEGGADLCVLPELWNTGYALNRLPELAQDSRGSSVRLLKKEAANRRLAVIGGSIAEKRDGVYANTLFCIDKNGATLAKYRKAHLFGPFGEGQYFQSGDDWGLVALDGLTVGLALCYDLRFPAFCRNLALRGAQALVVAAQWPSARLDHWRILLQARAVENQLYVIGVNAAAGADGAAGHSLVADPNGRILAEADESEQLLFSTIAPETIDAVRAAIPVYRDEKNILDEIDNSYL